MLAVVQDSADGRFFCGGNFDQIESGLTGEGERFSRRDDPELILFLIDHPDGGDPDHVVESKWLGDSLRPFNKNPVER